MKRDIDVIYLYEHVARELDVACAIKCILRLKYGASVEIVQWPYGAYDYLYNYKPKLVVLPFCYQEKSHNACLMEWSSAIYLNLTWEELFYKGNQAAKTPRGRFALNHVIHHTWGKFYSDFLIQQGVSPNNVFTNGNPAYQLYLEPYRRYFKDRTILADKHKLDTSKKWIFFPENYNWALYSEKTLENFIKNGQSREDVNRMREFCINSMNDVMKWCTVVSGLDNIEVIIRPRPATDIEVFRNSVKEILSRLPAHLHIIQDDTIREWILASDIVVSSHSTSLIESAIAGKQCFMLMPYKVPAALSMKWHNYIPQIKNAKEFINVCTSQNVSSDNSLLRQWAKEEMMNNGDSIFNIANYISELLNNNYRNNIPLSNDVVTYPSLFPIPKTMLFELRKIIFKCLYKLKNHNRIIYKEYVGKSEVEKRVSDWSNVLGHYIRNRD